jgi:hypothetical protein
MTMETGPKAHAKFSASGAKRWLECPASIALSESAERQGLKPVESKWAKEGTDAHTCLETFLKNGPLAHEYLKRRYPKDMVGHAYDAFKEIEKLQKAAPGSTLLCETRVDLSHIHPEMFGTTDAAIVDEFGRLIVIDFKYGAGIPVDTEDNPQLIMYGLGIAHEYHYNFVDVSLMVIQPRANHHSGETTRQTIVSIEELCEWGDKFSAGADACENPLADFKAGDHCRFCPAAAICPEIGQKALAQAKLDFAPDIGLATPPDPALLSAEVIRDILDAAPRIEKYLGAVREHAFQTLNRGHAIPGYKLVERKTTRTWQDLEKATAEARKLFGLKAFEPAVLLSPAKLEKALGKKQKSWVEERTVKASSGLTLAPESDKRAKAVPPRSAIADFDIVDTEGGDAPERPRKSLPKSAGKTKVKARIHAHKRR